MKTVALVPYWIDYHATFEKHKNLKKLGGRYLINYSLKLLGTVDSIQKTYVYASSKDILAYIDDPLEIDFLKRPKSLDDENVTIEDIIDAFLEDVAADVVVLLHPNSPFLQHATVSECIAKVLSGEHDSSFTASEYKKLCWYQGKPLNYSLDLPTPRPAEISPVFFEQSSLYVFTTKMYRKNRKRIGDNAYIKFIDHFEGHEINVEEDFKIAELIVNSGMYSEM